MAHVIFLGLDPRSTGQLKPLLAGDGHEVLSEPHNTPIGQLRSASAVFIGGTASDYVPLLRRLRAVDSRLPLIIVARTPATADWLEALEAGATDYLMTPLDASQVRTLIPPARMAATAGQSK